MPIPTRESPMSSPRLLVCPYCGEAQPAGDRCRSCGGLFDPLSRQATHNDMGPWYVRDPRRPFRPGCSYETLVRLVERGSVDRYTVLRGTTTRQFWTVARHVPGVANLLGYCHACDGAVDRGARACPSCGASFELVADLIFERNALGLPEVRPLPGDPGSHGHEPIAPPRRVAGNGVRRGGSISSFASDAELLLRRERPGSEFGAEPAARGEQLAANDRLQQATLDTLGRTLRATVDRQQATIRWLVVVAVVLALLAAWPLVRALVPAASGTSADAPTTSASTGATAAPVPSPAPRVETEPPPSPAPNAAPTAAGSTTDVASVPPAGAASDPPLDDASPEARAKHLLLRLESGDGALEARRAETQAMLAELESLQQSLEADAPGEEARRAALDELVEQMRAALAKLELESFTGTP